MAISLADAIKGYILDCKIEGQVGKTIHEKERVLARLTEWCETKGIQDLEAVTPIVLKEYSVYLQSYKRGDEERRVKLRGCAYSPQTIVDYFKMVRAFFAWCVREEYLTGTNPAKKVPHVKLPKKVIITFSPEQMRDLLNACDLTTALGFRDYTMLLVLMDTGIRRQELCNLQLADIHEDYIKVVGKFDKEREVGIGPTASRALFKYIHHFRKPWKESEQHVFLSNNGKLLDGCTIWQMLRRYSTRLGMTVTRNSPHTVRHSFAVEWLANKGDVVSLSRTLGHTNIQTTQIYLKDFQSREARQHHDAYSPVEVHKLGHRKGKKTGRDGV